MENKDVIWGYWGEIPHGDMVHRMDQDCCPHCNSSTDNRYGYIVGFSNDKTEFAKSTWDEARMEGAVTLECPACFEHSWVHANKELCEIFNACIRGNHNLFLVSGVWEQFKTMFERRKRSQERIPWQDWGQIAHEDMQHRVDPSQCPHCNFKEVPWGPRIVGFSNRKEEYRRSSWAGYPSEGAVTIECPKCFGLSWFHDTTGFCEDNDQKLRDLAVPTAKEACERMIERVRLETGVEE